MKSLFCQEQFGGQVGIDKGTWGYWSITAIRNVYVCLALISFIFCSKPINQPPHRPPSLPGVVRLCETQIPPLLPSMARLRTIRAHAPLRQLAHHCVTVIALVGDDFARPVHAHLLQV